MVEKCVLIHHPNEDILHNISYMSVCAQIEQTGPSHGYIKICNVDGGGVWGSDRL